MGKVYVIGIGPGAEELLTFKAKKAMEACDLLCGYRTYIELARMYLPQKEYYSTPMKQEIERCRYACERAREGKAVGMLCSGDAGIYGMAGPILEMAEDYDIEVEVIPGITAAISGAARLGAPLMNDFCVISLSDILTPWDVIEKRLIAAASGDLAIVLYNAMSKGRPYNLRKACDIVLKERSGETVCGYVRNIGREGEETVTLSLRELREASLDMFSTVFIGSSQSEIINGRMVTGRGYGKEKDDSGGICRDRHKQDHEEASDRKRIIIFGGTTEGREAAKELSSEGFEVCLSVATEIGEEALLSDAPENAYKADIRVIKGRRDIDQLKELIASYSACIDATHPYAQEITKNLKEVCGQLEIRYFRLLRGAYDLSDPERDIDKELSEMTSLISYASDASEAAGLLSGLDGNILLTTGSKDIKAFSIIKPERLFARVLPVEDSIKACRAAGIPHKNIIGMWGPFSEELNMAMIGQYDISYLVTKETGREGGFFEKLKACERTGCRAVVIKRPKEKGITLSEIRKELV